MSSPPRAVEEGIVYFLVSVKCVSLFVLSPTFVCVRFCTRISPNLRDATRHPKHPQIEQEKPTLFH